jgi:glycine cleavage system H protein
MHILNTYHKYDLCKNGVIYMPKWKTVRVNQELIEQAKQELEKGQYQNLSEFVSEAIRNRMQALTRERIPEYLERDKKSRVLYQRHPLFYTPKHVWAQATPQTNVKIGATDYFQSKLKEIVNIQTDKTGEEVSKDEPFGVVETWWFTYDLYSPLNGKIVSVNKKVIEDPFILNGDPYQWIVEVEPIPTEVHSWMIGLLSLGEYMKLVTK